MTHIPDPQQTATGPVNAWLIMGIELGAAMPGTAGVPIWPQRRTVVEPAMVGS
jgi:hypothetical protein